MAKLWVLLLYSPIVNFCQGSEPYCRQFEYDEKMLRKMIRTEIAMEALTKKLETSEKNIEKVIMSMDERFKVDFEESIQNLSIDGGWTDWSAWTECTTTCGVGIQSRYRSCDNPDRYLKGKPCEGPPSEYRSCSTQLCHDVGSLDIKASQGIGFTVRNPSQLKSGALLFTNVITNYGEDFNKDTGRFVCKVPGLYLFSVTLLGASSTSSACSCYINVGSSNKVLAYAHTKHTGDYPSGTATLVYKLTEGEEVYLGSCANYNKLDPSTHFSGVFIG